MRLRRATSVLFSRVPCQESVHPGAQGTSLGFTFYLLIHSQPSGNQAPALDPKVHGSLPSGNYLRLSFAMLPEGRSQSSFFC